MPTMPETFRPKHWPTRRENRRRYDRQRAEAQAWRAWYKTPAWHRLRAIVRKRSKGLCERHLARGEYVIGTEVHHKHAHRGERDLFFCDPCELELLCKPCHDRDAQREERSDSA